MDVVQTSLDELIPDTGVDLSAEQVGQLKRYRDLLVEYNKTTNLTAVRDVPGIDRRLIIESLRLVEPLRCLPRIDEVGRRSLLDVGTGGGLPGMVLAIACPEFNVFLLDATGKKVAFLDLAVRELGLANTTAIHGRAEELGHQPRYRNGFDAVSARAVSSLPALLEIGLPLLRTGGHLLLPKGAEIADELAAAEVAANILGGKIEAVDFLLDSGSTIDTRLVVVRKTVTTPSAYPRRSGIPSKSPLGYSAPKTPQSVSGRNGTESA
jgi:16S rRNA (guanine527-N7)-methyltransferase